MAGATAGSGTAMAAAGTGVAAGWGNAAATAMLVGAASTATTSTINNGGDLGATLDTLGSGDTLRGLATSGLTAGLTAGLYDPWLGTETGASQFTDAASSGSLLANSGTVTGTALGSASGIGRFALNQTLQNTTSAALGQALGQEGDLGDALRNSWPTPLLPPALTGSGMSAYSGGCRKVVLPRRGCTP
ncbi:DUF637 domain-containing protein [Alcanivorax sp. IO_7]|nr:DUF637 domain-containing protein [Alcanivorax sp. IO_7]